MTPPSAGATNSSPSVPADSNGVTGVRVGHSDLHLQVGSALTRHPRTGTSPPRPTARSSPTCDLSAARIPGRQVVFLGARRPTALQTNSVVVVPTLPSVPSITDPEVYLMSATTQWGGCRPVRRRSRSASVKVLLRPASSVSCRTTTSSRVIRTVAGWLLRRGDTASRMGPLTGICWVW